MLSFTFQEQHVDYSDTGGDGPVCIMIHGATGNRLYWPPALRHRPGFRIIALDLPGHGKSSGSALDSVAGYARCISELIEHLGITQSWLIGHSLGGAIAIETACRYPKRVAGLVLIATGPSLPVNSFILDNTKTEDRKPLVIRLLMNASYGRRMPQSVMDAATKILVDTPVEVFHNDYTACNTFDRRQSLQDIHCPVLILGGSIDKMAPFEYSQRLHEGLIRSELVECVGMGHMILLESPQETATMVFEWLSGKTGQPLSPSPTDS